MGFEKWRDGILELRLRTFQAGQKISTYDLPSVLVDPSTMEIFDIEDDVEFITFTEQKFDRSLAEIAGTRHTIGGKFVEHQPEGEEYITSDRDFWGIESSTVHEGPGESFLDHLISESGLVDLIGYWEHPANRTVLSEEYAKDLTDALESHVKRLASYGAHRLDDVCVSVLYLAEGWTDCYSSADGTEYDNGIDLHKIALSDFAKPEGSKP